MSHFGFFSKVTAVVVAPLVGLWMLGGPPRALTHCVGWPDSSAPFCSAGIPPLGLGACRAVGGTGRVSLRVPMIPSPAEPGLGRGRLQPGSALEELRTRFPADHGGWLLMCRPMMALIGPLNTQAGISGLNLHIMVNP